MDGSWLPLFLIMSRVRPIGNRGDASAKNDVVARHAEPYRGHAKNSPDEEVGWLPILSRTKGGEVSRRSASTDEAEGEKAQRVVGNVVIVPQKAKGKIGSIALPGGPTAQATRKARRS